MAGIKYILGRPINVGHAPTLKAQKDAGQRTKGYYHCLHDQFSVRVLLHDHERRAQSVIFDSPKFGPAAERQMPGTRRWPDSVDHGLRHYCPSELSIR